MDGHHGLLESICNAFEKYLNSRVKKWSLPNPASGEPEYLIPRNLYWSYGVSQKKTATSKKKSALPAQILSA